jgi:hypothetical protein
MRGLRPVDAADELAQLVIGVAVTVFRCLNDQLARHLGPRWATGGETGFERGTILRGSASRTSLR